MGPPFVTIASESAKTKQPVIVRTDPHREPEHGIQLCRLPPEQDRLPPALL
jgi:hypothetical protein